MPSLAACGTVRADNVSQSEALRRTCYERIGARGNLERTVRLLHDERLRGRDARDATATLLHLLYIIGYRVLRYQRTHAVMDQHRSVIAARIVLGSTQSVVYRVLSGVAAGHYSHHLSNLELAQLLLQERNPTLYTRHDDGVDEWMIVEKFERIDYYRLAVEVEKLLRTRFRVHPFSCSSGKYHSYVHIFLFLGVRGKGVRKTISTLCLSRLSFGGRSMKLP